MPATPTIIGALLGLGTQMYSNALRKLPYMRRIAPFLPPFPFLDLSFCDASIPRPGSSFLLICISLVLVMKYLGQLGVFVSPICACPVGRGS